MIKKSFLVVYHLKVMFKFLLFCFSKSELVVDPEMFRQTYLVRLNFAASVALERRLAPMWVLV